MPEENSILMVQVSKSCPNLFTHFQPNASKDGFGNPHGGLVFSNIWVNGTGGLGEVCTPFPSDKNTHIEKFYP